MTYDFGLFQTTSPANIDVAHDVAESAASSTIVNLWANIAPSAALRQAGPLTRPISRVYESDRTKTIGLRQISLLIEKVRMLRDSHPFGGELGSCFYDAFNFIGALPIGIFVPNVWTDGEGEIAFEWIDEQRHAVVSLEGDGKIGYTYRVDGRFVPGTCRDAEASVMPKDLIEYLS